MRPEKLAKFKDGYYGGPVDPTADRGVDKADGRGPVLTSSLPPPDEVWIPQLYQQYNLAATARISQLPVEQVKQILIAQGIPIRGKGRPKADKANRSPW